MDDRSVLLRTAELLLTLDRMRYLRRPLYTAKIVLRHIDDLPQTPQTKALRCAMELHIEEMRQVC